MKAAWYEKIGDAKDVFNIDEVDFPKPSAGQVLVKVLASGINPSDVKQRSGWGGLKMRYPRVVPHNDGAGVIEAGVDTIVEVDFAANLETNLKILKNNSAIPSKMVAKGIATYASDSQTQPQIPVYSLIYKNLAVHYVLVYAMSKEAHQAAIEDITTCLKAGVLRHVIAQRFKLSEIAQAHQMMETGKAIGNLVIEIGE
jgi:NADPH:quinone reductase-like Zn-dependent oxidoreductase